MEKISAEQAKVMYKEAKMWNRLLGRLRGLKSNIRQYGHDIWHGPAPLDFESIMREHVKKNPASHVKDVLKNTDFLKKLRGL